MCVCVCVCVCTKCIDMCLCVVVDCPPGEYWVEADDPALWGYCRLAEVGYYAPNPRTVGFGNLTACPDGETTEEPGAASQALCFGTCVCVCVCVCACVCVICVCVSVCVKCV